MTDMRWFKVWGREVLASPDLASLSDHEERVWWRLLAAASSADPRWSIEENDGLARLCASTPQKFRAALGVMERRGMVNRCEGLIRVVNADRYQDTPEARRKRKERDRERDMSGESHGQNADMSRTSHDRGGEERGREDKITSSVPSEVGAKAPRRLRKPLSDEQREKLRTDFSPLRNVDERIEEALAHRASLNATDEYLYLRTWLRKDLERMPSNGRNATPVSSAAEQAERERLRTLGVI